MLTGGEDLEAGLSTETVLEQIDIFGEEVLPVLRQEFAALKPADVPEAPTHEFLVERHRRGEDPVPGGAEGSQAYADRQQALAEAEQQSAKEQK